MFPLVLAAILVAFATVGLVYVGFRLLPSPEWRSEPSAFLLGIIGGIGVLGLPLLISVLISAFVDRKDFIDDLRKNIRAIRSTLIGRDLLWRRAAKNLAKELERIRNSPPPDPRREEITAVRDYYRSIAREPERAAILGIDLAQCRHALEQMAAELSMDVDKFLQDILSESIDRSVDDSIDY